jgi:hypothetical protein
MGVAHRQFRLSALNCPCIPRRDAFESDSSRRALFGLF